MKKLYFLNEEEKNRILNLHENATKRQYLGEQVTNQKNLPTITDNDKTYDYQKNGDTYFFKVKPNATDSRAQKYKDGNWHQAKGSATTAIKALFDKKPNGTQTQVKQNKQQIITKTSDTTKQIQTLLGLEKTGKMDTGLLQKINDKLNGKPQVAPKTDVVTQPQVAPKTDVSTQARPKVEPLQQLTPAGVETQQLTTQNPEQLAAGLQQMQQKDITNATPQPETSTTPQPELSQTSQQALSGQLTPQQIRQQSRFDQKLARQARRNERRARNN